MYGIFTYIYHKIQPNVGKYTSPMDAMGRGNLNFEWTKSKGKSDSEPMG